jgi:hypothetical protein
VLALVLLAAETLEDEPSKAPFYIMGGILALFGVGLAAVGIARHATFPPSAGVQRAVVALAVLLAAGAMATAVITA